MKVLDPQLIIVRGPVGSGKTSVVEELRKLVKNVSIVDFDAFKRQIDNAQSSAWRRQIALDTALYMTRQLMAKHRVIAVNVHSAKTDQLDAFLELAAQSNYKVSTFLLYPPLDVCIERCKARVIPDITYEIDLDMIKSYWHNTVFIDKQQVYNDPGQSPGQIAADILKRLK